MTLTPPRPHPGQRVLHSQGAWANQAEALFIKFGLRCAGRAFLTEEAGAYAHARGLPLPQDGRTWGGVVTRLRRASQIAGHGYALTHDVTPKTLWRLGGHAKAKTKKAKPKLKGSP